MENSTQDKNYAYFQDVIREMLKLMGLQIKLKKINSSGSQSDSVRRSISCNFRTKSKGKLLCPDFI